MAADTVLSAPDSCFHCCSKCKGLFGTSADHMKHQVDCSGNPFKCTSMFFACERKIFLQLFQSEDFQLTDGSFSLLNISKDDSFIDHVVKIRMPQDIIDPSIFLRTNTSSLQPPLQDARFLLDTNNMEPEINKSDEFMQSNKPMFSESIEHDQLRKIISKNIDYLKSDEMPSLAAQSNKDLQFTHSQSEPRLLSPIDKHFLPDGPKSRVQSPFEKCVNYLQDTSAGYQTSSLTYSSSQSVPFACNLTTDLLGGLASTHEENLTSVDELPTLQYLDLAKKDLFFGQTSGVNQVNTKDPFLINATVKPDRPVSSGPRYQTQPSKSCEDLQTSPTFPLHDGNYFNFPSTLDEPTQLDYLDLATLDFLTNPTTFSNYGLGMYRDRSSVDRDDINSECNFLFHEQSNQSTENVEKMEKKSFEDNVKLTKSKIKRIRLKKIKRGIEKKTKPSNAKKTTSISNENISPGDGRIVEALTDSIGSRSSTEKKSFKRTYSAEYDTVKTPTLTRKRKLMSCNDTISFRISPDAKKKMRSFDRKFNESQRLCATNAILNVKDSLQGYTEEEKGAMTAVFGQLGCIVVKKQKSGTKLNTAPEQVISEVSTGMPVGESKMFVLDGKNLQSLEKSSVTDAVKVQAISPLPVNSSSSDNVKSVLVLKCQHCKFTTASVTDFKHHNESHENYGIRRTKSLDEKLESEVSNDFDFTTCSLSVPNSVNDSDINEVFGDDNSRYTATNETIDFNSADNQRQQSNNRCADTDLSESLFEFYETVGENKTNKTDYNKLTELSRREETSFEYMAKNSKSSDCSQYKFTADSGQAVTTSNSESPIASSIDSLLEPPSGSYSSDIFSATEGIVSLSFEDSYSFSSPALTKVEPTSNTIFSLGKDPVSSLSTSLSSMCSLMQESIASASVKVRRANEKIGNIRRYSLDESQIACNILQEEVLPKMASTAEDGSSKDSWSDIVSGSFVNTCITMSEEMSEAVGTESPKVDEKSFLDKKKQTQNLEQMPEGPFQTVPESSISAEIIPKDFTLGQQKFEEPESTCSSDFVTSASRSEDKETESTTKEYTNAENNTPYDFDIDLSDKAEKNTLEALCSIGDNDCEADNGSSVSRKHENDHYDVEKGMKILSQTEKSDCYLDHIRSESSCALSQSSETKTIRDKDKCTKDTESTEFPSKNIDKRGIITLGVESVDEVGQCKENEDFAEYFCLDTENIHSSVKEKSISEMGKPNQPVINTALAHNSYSIGSKTTERSIPFAKTTCTVTRISETIVKAHSDCRVSQAVDSDQTSQHTVAGTPSVCNIIELDHCYCGETRSGDAKQPVMLPPYQIITEQSQTGGSSSICEHSEVQAKGKHSLRAHQQRHDCTLLSCSVPGCGFKTQHQKNLTAHLLRHNPSHQLLCDQCTFTTSDRSSLKKHIQSAHYRYYRFKCPDCDYLSMVRENITKHYRNTHLDEKLYACNQCHYRTGYTHLLKLHLMAHAGIRPYKCTACEYQVNNVNKVTRHIKTRHKGQVGITYEKLDLDFEVDAKQFQCEVKTRDKDINVIEVTEEQVKEVIRRKLAKQKKSEQAKMKIPVFNPKKQKQKMVSILPEEWRQSDETETGEGTCYKKCQKRSDQHVVVKGKMTVMSPWCTAFDDTHCQSSSTKGYSGEENGLVSTNKLLPCLTDQFLRDKSAHTEEVKNDLGSEYQCSMCNFRLKNHADIVQHLLVCKMERNRLT